MLTASTVTEGGHGRLQAGIFRHVRRARKAHCCEAATPGSGGREKFMSSPTDVFCSVAKLDKALPLRTRHPTAAARERGSPATAPLDRAENLRQSLSTRASVCGCRPSLLRCAQC
eukprot:11733552-Alexandrium_andersonii.AAC.1